VTAADPWLGRPRCGERESGACLLARSDDHRRNVPAIAFYDDLDPSCLTGGITFKRTGYSRLWDLCEASAVRVVADVHTHPGSRVSQSSIDAANPMIAEVAHIAVIVPNFGRGHPGPDRVGVTVFQGADRWEAALGPHARQLLQVGWSAAVSGCIAVR
jgi:hypothetical protein